MIQTGFWSAKLFIDYIHVLYHIPDLWFWSFREVFWLKADCGWHVTAAAFCWFLGTCSFLFSLLLYSRVLGTRKTRRWGENILWIIKWKFLKQKWFMQVNIWKIIYLDCIDVFIIINIATSEIVHKKNKKKLFLSFFLQAIY